VLVVEREPVVRTDHQVVGSYHRPQQSALEEYHSIDLPIWGFIDSFTLQPLTTVGPFAYLEVIEQVFELFGESSASGG
jgi:hypothetical protein